MKIFDIDLTKEFPKLTTGVSAMRFTAYLREDAGYLPDEFLFPAVLVLPGGGFTHISPREGEPVAMRFVGEGFSAFCLEYSVAPDRYPISLEETFAAICHIRRHAKEYGIDSKKLSVIGFSAGGMLASSSGIFYKKERFLSLLGASPEELKPNALIFSYGATVSNDDKIKHRIDNMYGGKIPQGGLELLRSWEHIDADFPPSYIWQAYDDSKTLSANALKFVSILRKNNIEFELHIFSKGEHGMSLCEFMTCDKNVPGQINPHCKNWFPMCIEWIKQVLNVQ